MPADSLEHGRSVVWTIVRATRALSISLSAQDGAGTLI
jgi:hypothetical protein